MRKLGRNLKLLTIGLAIVLLSSGVAAYVILSNSNRGSVIKVACVGDSLTQSTEYPYDLMMQLGTEHYDLHNFGAGSTTVSLASETPYMNTTVYQDALNYQPNIVIIMLGTNDAQPSLHRYNASFAGDYVKLIDSFKELASKPQVWVVVPPPIFSNQSGKMDTAYFEQTILPGIEQAANQTSLPTIDVYSALSGHPEYSTDGVHINGAGAKVIADKIYTTIFMGKAP